jgi:PAS domain S-box-containing protein
LETDNVNKHGDKHQNKSDLFYQNSSTHSYSKADYYRELLNTLPNPVFEIDAEGTFIYLNSTGCKRLGLSKEKEYLGISLFDYVTEDGERVKNDLSRILSKGEQGRIELSISVKGKMSFPAALHVIPVMEGDKVVRFRGIIQDTTLQRSTEKERERLIAKLQEALANIKSLRGLLPICAHCKRIRDEMGKWHALEEYISAHTEAEFSHGLCPDCLQSLYPDMFAQQREFDFKEREE